MKKVILIMMLAFGMIATSNAQVVLMPTEVGGTKTVDTTDNTEVNYLYYKTENTKYGSIQVVVTKISGTPNGQLMLEYSNDGVNYKAIATSDTANVANTSGAVTHWFAKTTWPYKYVRIKSTGRGTASYKLSAYLNPKRD